MKLADFVMNSDLVYLEPARQPPETVEMKRLYEDLWGRVEPPNPIVPGNRASEMLLHEFFPPITAENVSERLKKMTRTVAARPEGLKKEHLLMPSLPTIIAK